MTVIEQLNQWTEEAFQCPAAQEKMRTLAPYMEALKKGFAPWYIDAFYNAQMEVEAAECEAAFVRGFRLGVQLVVEGLR